MTHKLYVQGCTAVDQVSDPGVSGGFPAKEGVVF